MDKLLRHLLHGKILVNYMKAVNPFYRAFLLLIRLPIYLITLLLLLTILYPVYLMWAVAGRLLHRRQVGYLSERGIKVSSANGKVTEVLWDSVQEITLEKLSLKDLYTIVFLVDNKIKEISFDEIGNKEQFESTLKDKGISFRVIGIRSDDTE